jgi:predicted RNase H-like HicB family nuclease
MIIRLTRGQLEAALPRLSRGLEQYMWLQEHRGSGNLFKDHVFRRRFNRFYRVRRGTEWQDKFYRLLWRKRGEPVSFGEILRTLHRATGRYESSFASKLVATIRPEMPVIDSVVLRNVDLRLPRYNARDRTARLARLYATLVSWFNAFLRTETGRYLVKRFREEYPDARISEVKMLDLVLWQTRPNNPLHRSGACDAPRPISAGALQRDVGSRARLYDRGAGGRMRNELTAVVERAGRWHVAYCPEIPGANGQGRTKATALKSLANAIALILEDRRKDGLRGVPASARREKVVVG